MEQNKSGIGSIIGIVIIISIIILGGLYFWGKRIEEAKLKQELVNGTVPTTMQEQNEAAAIRSIGSSDDLTSIEADLEATNLNNLGAEVN